MARAAFRAASRAIVFAAVLCFAGLLAPSSSNAASPGQRFRQVEIVDPNGFEQPMPAIRGLIPAGWQDQGGIVWNPQAPCGADGIQIDHAVTLTGRPVRADRSERAGAQRNRPDAGSGLHEHQPPGLSSPAGF